MIGNLYAQTSSINRASGEAVKRGLIAALSATSTPQWLDPANPYFKDARSSLGKQTAPPFADRIDSPALASYIAVSAPTHCLDGWRFLARALSAHLSMDARTARHMAYYASLRAALSILAAAGIAIFDDHQFVVQDDDECIELRLGTDRKRTHTAVWDLLSRWAETQTAVDRLSKILAVDGHNLEEWLGPIAKVRLRTELPKFLTTCGLDLNIVSGDRVRRNLASYAPSSVFDPMPPDLQTTVEFVVDFWKSVEPSSSIGFDRLDRHLLREMLETTVLQRPRSEPRPTPTHKHTRNVKALVRNVDSTPEFMNRWTTFLDGSEEPATLSLIINAKTNSDAASSRVQLEMISRAALLLRIATGQSRELLSLPSTLLHRTTDWRDQLGVTLGFWDAAIGGPVDYTDLWTDVSAELQGNDWARPNITNMAYSSWRLSSSRGMDLAAQCERIPMWSLSPA